MNDFRTMHLFAGIGGGLLADLILGHKPIIAVEWDKYACRILRERAADGWFPDLSVWEGDVRLFDPSEYAGRVDCIHAGFPCQDISVAGKQAGLGEGTRSGLYREVLRIAGVVRPRYLFLENVSAILSNGLGCVLGDLAAMGYDVKWCCIRASDVGAPHGRDRWFCLCTRRADFPPHTEHERDGRGEQQQEGIAGEADVVNTVREGFSSVDRRGAIPNAQRNSEGEEPRWEQQQSWSSSSSELADPKRDRLQGQRKDGNVEGQAGLCGRTRSNKEQDICDTTPDWWATQSAVGQLANGVPNRVGAIKGLGNAQVPLQAAAAWRLLTRDLA